MNVSILMATFNGEKYLEAQLDSILCQSYENFKLYISDDGSKDNTLEILKKYAEKDSRISLLCNHEPNKSSCRNFLYLLENVISDVYLFSDQDDVWEKNHVEKLVSEYCKCSEQAKALPVLVHGDLKVVNENLTVISDSALDYMNLPRNPKYSHFYFVQNNVTGCVSLINNELKKYVYLNKQFLMENMDVIPMHDNFFSTIASEFGKIIFINESLELYRQHDFNVLGAQNSKNLFRLIKKMLGFSNIKMELYRGINYTKFFVEYFHEQFDEKERLVLQEFSNIKSKNKIQRIKFIKKNEFLKYGLLRKLMYILFI